MLGINSKMNFIFSLFLWTVSLPELPTMSHIVNENLYPALRSQCREMQIVKSGCPICGRAQGQVGRGIEQPSLVEGVTSHGRGAWNEVPCHANPSMIPWSFHSHQGLLIPPVLTTKCQSHWSLDNMQTTLTFSFKPVAETPPLPGRMWVRYHHWAASWL